MFKQGETVVCSSIKPIRATGKHEQLLYEFSHSQFFDCVVLSKEGQKRYYFAKQIRQATNEDINNLNWGD